ncbi:MAG: hypothetical protein LBU58_09600 [Clostridiales bacterium]|jgi:hypothetical protein|nr:hypothetical protein [Clostridiales bacterium]
MNSKKLFNAIGGIDDKFISEQAEKMPTARQKNIYGADKKAARPFLRRSAFAAATAAALVFCAVFGYMLINPKISNVFDLKAYAIEQREDGSFALHEADLLGRQTFSWITYNGSFFYVSADLKCEGENLKSVDFYTDDGFFAKQYLRTENGETIAEEGVPASYHKAPGDTVYTLKMYSHDFDVIGDAFTLEKDAMIDDYLLFWGTEISDWQATPSKATIRAVATFDDGKTQEKTITLNIESEIDRAGALAGIVYMPPEESERMRAESIRREELVHSIPLEQCEVVPGSEVILTYGDTFEYHSMDTESGDTESDAWTAMFPITEESMDPENDRSLERDGFPGLFDENGVARFGSALYAASTWEEYDGGDGYISVIENNGDGTFTGKTYKVPGWLILEKSAALT